MDAHQSALTTTRDPTLSSTSSFPNGSAFGWQKLTLAELPLKEMQGGGPHHHQTNQKYKSPNKECKGEPWNFSACLSAPIRGACRSPSTP